MKKLIALFLAVAFVLAMGVSFAEEAITVPDSALLKKGALIVGMCDDYVPFEYPDDNGTIIGFDPDMAKYLASLMVTEDGQPVEIEFVKLQFHDIISALQLGQVDVGIAAFSYSPERKCAFSTPYYSSAQVVAVRTDSDIDSIAQLNGKLVVAGEGTVGYDAACEMIEGASVTNAGGSYMTMFEMVRTGQCDAIVADITVTQTYVDSGNFKIIDKLTSDELCVTVREGNDALVEAVNKAIEQFYASGKYEELKNEWNV